MTTSKKIEDIPDYKILVNADGHINGSIIYYSFPQVWYQKESIESGGLFL